MPATASINRKASEFITRLIVAQMPLIVYLALVFVQYVNRVLTPTVLASYSSQASTPTRCVHRAN